MLWNDNESDYSMMSDLPFMEGGDEAKDSLAAPSLDTQITYDESCFGQFDIIIHEKIDLDTNLVISQRTELKSAQISFKSVTIALVSLALLIGAELLYK